MTPASARSVTVADLADWVEYTFQLRATTTFGTATSRGAVSTAKATPVSRPDVPG